MGAPHIFYSIPFLLQTTIDYPKCLVPPVKRLVYTKKKTQKQQPDEALNYYIKSVKVTSKHSYNNTRIRAHMFKVKIQMASRRNQQKAIVFKSKMHKCILLLVVAYFFLLNQITFIRAKVTHNKLM